MPIQVLSDELSSRIAAGEVIERPASVVKELVENSLDAGSTRIDVQVVGGGANSITVVDNGDGIPADELPVAFERFATSKIDETSDLITIGTLGFRGEALPSIASVARVEITSRHGGAEAGASYVVDFGKPGLLEAAGAPQGTRISVSGLFTNVPARLKFLGSGGRELSRIQRMLASLALVCPHVAFSLAADGRERLHTVGSGGILDAVSGVYGQKIADQMLLLEADESAAFSVDGLISSPSLNRSNRTYMTLSVNGRWIQSRRLTYAIEQAYYGFLPERRFPIAVARIHTPLDDVDANVHPAKTEVRLLREDLVYSIAQRAVRGVLSAHAPVHALGSGRAGGSLGLLRTPVSPGNRVPGNGDRTKPPAGRGYSQWPGPFVPTETEAVATDDIGSTQAPLTEPGASVAAGPEAASNSAATPRDTLPVLRVIGQSHETYIVAEGPGGVYLIDQHAAHERVLYEQLLEQMERQETPSQKLLLPETVELSATDAQFVTEQMKTLNRLGVGISAFGDRTFLLDALPPFVKVKDTKGFVLLLIDELKAAGQDVNSMRLGEGMVIMTVCRQAIKANDALAGPELEKLLEDLRRCTMPYTCPHGRPTLIEMSYLELEKKFGRTV